MKDSQRSKVYAAERCIQSDPSMEWDEVLAFVDKVMKSAYVRNNYPFIANKGVVTLKGRNGGVARNSYFDSYNRRIISGPVITLGVWGRRKSVILHELAHHFAGLHNQHNWRFCEVYLGLVRHFLGKEAHDKLKASYKEHRVRFRKPVKRTLTPEQREAAAARLAAARAAKAARVAEAVSA